MNLASIFYVSITSVSTKFTSAIHIADQASEEDQEQLKHDYEIV
jgi:hypothetical protein